MFLLTFQDKTQQHMVQDKTMWHMVELSNISNVRAYVGFQIETFNFDRCWWHRGFRWQMLGTICMKPVHNDQVDNILDMNIIFAFPSLVCRQLKRTKFSDKNSNNFSWIRSGSMSRILRQWLVSATEIQLLHGHFGS